MERPDGVRLSLTVRTGPSAPLVLVHGAVADAAARQPTADGIDGPVVAVNRRGRAPSGPLGADYSLRTEIADLHHVLDEFPGAALFGHSYGAVVALETAVERTDLAALVLYEPVVAVPEPFAGPALQPLRAAVAAGDLDTAVEVVNRDVSLFSQEYVDRLRASEAWAPTREFMPAAAEELRVIDEHRPDLAAYGRIDIPVTLLVGSESENTRPYGPPFAAVADAMPRARVVRLPGQGRLAHLTGPDVLARAINEALRG